MLVNLKKRVKLDGGWTFVPVPRKKGRLLPEEITATGTFYIEWRQDGRRRQEPVGTNGRTALEALRTKQNELDDLGTQGRRAHAHSDSLEAAAERFLLNTKATKSVGTAEAYKAHINWFLKRTTKTRIHEIDRDEIMRLFAKGRQDGLDQKTINVKLIVVFCLIRSEEHDVKLKKGDWPKTSESDPEVYTPEQLARFFNECNERERVMFSTFLYTGFRHMEVATLQWDGDIDWHNHTLKVRVKPDLKFYPKNYEWRTVKVPRGLIEMLKVWKKKSTSPLVFPTLPHPTRPKYQPGGGVDKTNRMLDQCRRVALRAGLNCGSCINWWGTCDVDPACQHFYLHKFRHTFATNMLRSGVDIKSVQNLLGHAKLSTTEKYLKALDVHDLESKVENSTLIQFLR